MTAAEFKDILALRDEYRQVSEEWRFLRERSGLNNPVVEAKLGLLRMIALDLREDHGIDIDDIL